MLNAVNIFALALILSGVISLLLCWYIFQKLTGGVRFFATIMLGIAVWAIGYGIELNCSTLGDMQFWSNVQCLGISFLPLFWIIFVIKFIGKNNWLTIPLVVLLFIEPVLTLFFKWNPASHLVFKNISIDLVNQMPMLHFTPGLWYYVHTIYFYTLLSVGMFLLISRFKNTHGLFKRQNIILILGISIPWVIHITYLFNLRPLRHIDLTPVSFILTSFIVGLGFLRYKLFDLIPIAREKVIEVLSEGILVIDSLNRIIDLNPEMVCILGDKNRRWVGKNFNGIFNEIDFTQSVSLVEASQNIEVTLEINNKRHYYSVKINPIFEKKGCLSGKVLLFRDITERKESLLKLESLNQLKDRLFSIIAHDLRSPLLSLMDILNLVGEGMVTDEEFKTFLPKIAKNIGYTSGLVENLLYWSKSQLSGMVIDTTHVDIYAMSEMTLEAFADMVAGKGLNVSNQITSGTFVLCDKHMLQAVFRNLITNAIKFCRPGDKINIACNVEGGYATIKVSDTGIGISNENQAKLFASQTFTTMGTINEKGTGLGLLLCKDFVEKNKGEIWVESVLNQGSTFYFSLPVAV
jgi:PAS domain S-box-containing protein